MGIGSGAYRSPVAAGPALIGARTKRLAEVRWRPDGAQHTATMAYAEKSLELFLDGLARP